MAKFLSQIVGRLRVCLALRLEDVQAADILSLVHLVRLA
jgi:hypothetical protein